jgi:hypothetical protein
MCFLKGVNGMSLRQWIILIVFILFITYYVIDIILELMSTLRKHSNNEFKEKCPDVRCTCCSYHYYDENDESRCGLEDQLNKNTGYKKEE